MAVGVGAQRLQPLQRRDRESSLPHLRGDCHATSPAPPPTCLPSRLRAAGAEQANGLTHTHDGQRRAAVGERSSRRPMRACPCPLARRPLSACLSVCLSVSLSLSLSLSVSLCLPLPLFLLLSRARAAGPAVRWRRLRGGVSPARPLLYIPWRRARPSRGAGWRPVLRCARDGRSACCWRPVLGRCLHGGLRCTPNRASPVALQTTLQASLDQSRPSSAGHTAHRSARDRRRRVCQFQTP